MAEDKLVAASDSRLDADLARRLRELGSTALVTREQGASLSGTYIEAVVWVLVSALIWLIAILSL